MSEVRLGWAASASARDGSTGEIWRGVLHHSHESSVSEADSLCERLPELAQIESCAAAVGAGP